MKRQGSYAIRAARFGAVSLCCAGALYLALDTMLLPDTSPGGGQYRGNQRANCGSDSQDAAIPVERALLPSLPEDWQAQWRSGMLWITHYNPNGTVADCLPFEDLKSYRDWVQTRPDFCDADVEKLARRVPWISACRERAGTWLVLSEFAHERGFALSLFLGDTGTLFERVER
jgi:hypothetical protein